MNKFKVACLLVSLVFSLAIFGALVNQPIVVAQEEKIELNSKYPIRPGPVDISFTFDVELIYSGGEEQRTFELSAVGPDGWLVSILQSAYEATEISAIRLDPTKAYPETIAVYASAPYWLFPEPGDYTITLKAAAGEIEDSIDLTARVTARYDFLVGTETGRLDIKSTAGKESHLTVIITNLGTAPLNQITFRSVKPRVVAGEAWSVNFDPDKIENLNPWDEREVEVVIKPPPKTIAGDYMTTLEFNSDPQTSIEPPKLEIRVQVMGETSTIWIGTGIVVAVLAALYFVFRRFGRR
ncbi:NEW3 domain-containing protein [Chloroflexota bacterium]